MSGGFLHSNSRDQRGNMFFVICCLAGLSFLQNIEGQHWHSYNPYPYSNHGQYNDNPIYAEDSAPVDVLASVGKVKLDVYYETNCPDSMRFITSQLYPVYNHLKDILDVTIVPFGKATHHYDPSFNKYTFRCQHGPRECYGNAIQSCAISFYPQDDYMNFVNCMQSYPTPSESGGKCAQRFGLDYKKLSKCADGVEGHELLYKNGQVTHALNPPLTFVPWIVVNKEYSDTTQKRAQRDLKGVVCEAYKGTYDKC